MASQFAILLDKIQKNEVAAQPKSPKEMQALMDYLNSKLHKKGHDKLFHLFRAKIEDMLKWGYRVERIT